MPRSVGTGPNLGWWALTLLQGIDGLVRPLHYLPLLYLTIFYKGPLPVLFVNAK